MGSGFLQTAQEGLVKLRRQRYRLLKKLDAVHVCNCEFCTRKGEEVRSLKIALELQELDKEITRIEGYIKDHS